MNKNPLSDDDERDLIDQDSLFYTESSYVKEADDRTVILEENISPLNEASSSFSSRRGEFNAILNPLKRRINAYLNLIQVAKRQKEQNTSFLEFIDNANKTFNDLRVEIEDLYRKVNSDLPDDYPYQYRRSLIDEIDGRVEQEILAYDTGIDLEGEKIFY